MDFKSRHSFAFDEASGISISHPRALPAKLPGGDDGIEYQYSFRRDDQRIGALAIFGAETALEEAGRRVWLYKFDLADDPALQALLRFKRDIGSSDDIFVFIQSMAQGLMKVFAEEEIHSEAQRNVIYTNVDALVRNGVMPPVGIEVAAGGRIVLAEAFVPAHEE
ncbi:MAG: hypothetical protein RR778_09855 [Glutamicibacter sp.]|uniref:hypothetical protein n=1 Tax=Bacteria TaxID=2 RepID=UPI002FC9A307